MKSTTLASFSSALAFLLLPVDIVSADSTESFTHTTAAETAPFIDTFTLPAFDPSLGTLVAIDLSAQENTTADVVVFNATANSQPFTNAQASIPVTISGPAGTTFTITDLTSPVDGTAVVGGNDFPGIQSTTSDSVQIDPSQFSSWEGASGQTVGVDFSVTDGTFSGIALPDVFFGGTVVAGGSTTVTYTFQTLHQVVPEPSTWALMLGGLSLLVYWRMHRGLN